jgi:dihydroneopterin aldolase
MSGLDAAADRIEVRGLRVLGVHGVLPEERDRAQPFRVDFDLWLDTAAAGASDALADTVDYGEAVARAQAVLAGPSRQLLEALAGTVADRLLDLDPRITAVTVAVHKEHPPLPADLGSVGVRVVRHRTP